MRQVAPGQQPDQAAVEAAVLTEYENLFVYLEKFPFADNVRDACLSNLATGIARGEFARDLAVKIAKTISYNHIRWRALASIVETINDASNPLARQIVGNFTDKAYAYMRSLNSNSSVHVNYVRSQMREEANH